VARGDDTTGVSGSATRVTETGIALVHEGELILPAEGSEAGLEDVGNGSGTIVQYVFPVEIEVRSVGAEVDPDSILDATLDALAEGLAAL